jgi:hypothetical protein
VLDANCKNAVTWFDFGLSAAFLYRHFERETPFFELGSLMAVSLRKKSVIERAVRNSEPRRAGKRRFSGIAPHRFSAPRRVAPSRIEPADEFWSMTGRIIPNRHR